MNKSRISNVLLAVALALLIIVAVIINTRPVEAHDCYPNRLEPAQVCGFEMKVDPFTGKTVSVYVCR